MSTVKLESNEFTFFPPGVDGGEFQYSALVAGVGVVLARIDHPELGPIGFDVPRRVAEKIRPESPSDLARYAIGQALRDGLFNAHPSETAYLDEDAPRWAGNLTAVR
jgi:hypothetical protein